MPEATATRPAPAPRPRPEPVPRPTITGEQFGKLVARIWASSSLPVEAKKDIINMVAAMYGFRVDWEHGQVESK